MNRQDPFRSGFPCHPPRLLRCAMESNPGVVSTDGHDRQICAANLAKIRAIRGVTGEDNSVSAGVDEVTGIATICVRPKSRAPVVYFEALNANRTHADLLTPAHFVHRP